MSDGFTKVYSSILLSTVWREPNHVRLVWITMLALANRRGYVGASVPGLADAARVTLEECEDALARFQAPDKYSRSRDYEGRRIVEAEGGWTLLNYQKYREKRDPEKRGEQNREAKARQRAKQKSQPNVSQSQPKSAQAEAEAEANSDHQKRASAHGGGDGTDPGKETGCPLDLLDRLESSGMVRSLAEKLPAPIEAVRDEVRQFLAYWTIGKGMGQRRTNWAGKARQWVIDQHSKRGGLEKRTTGSGGPSNDWPTDRDISLRERIRSGEFGDALQAELGTGKLDASLARRRIAELRSRSKQARPATRLRQDGFSGVVASPGPAENENALAGILDGIGKAMA